MCKKCPIEYQKLFYLKKLLKLRVCANRMNPYGFNRVIFGVSAEEVVFYLIVIVMLLLMLLLCYNTFAAPTDFTFAIMSKLKCVSSRASIILVN